MSALPLRAPLATDGDDHLAVIKLILEARGAPDALVGNAAQIVDRLRHGVQPRIIVLDLDPGADADAEMAEVAGAAHAGTAILVVGRVNDIHVFRRLLAAGASDYISLPSTPETLTAAVDRLLTSIAADVRSSAGANIVVVVGTRGGVGATTASITLGWILAEEMAKRTAVLDLDLHFGTLALALDIDPGHGLRDALEKPERIDGLYIDRAMVKVANNLFALSAEEAIDEDPAYDPAAVAVLLGELKRKFDWIVVDLPRGAGPLARNVLAAASHTVIIADSTLAGLRDTMRLQNFMRTCNPLQRSLVLRGGLVIGQGGVSRAAFEKELGRPLDGAIPNDQKASIEAANAGRPLPQVARQSPVAAAMRNVAVNLAGAAPAKRKFKLSLRLGRK